jgi:hypothetical protein
VSGLADIINSLMAAKKTTKITSIGSMLPSKVGTGALTATPKPPTAPAPVAPSSVLPPPGQYDPALDAQGRAGDRGLAQLLQDLGKAGTRAESQYTIDKGQINQGADWSLADLLTGHNREGEDYGNSTRDLNTSYQRLGQSQAGHAVQAGVQGGGTFAAALAARTTNQQHDQSGLDLAHTRSGEDYNTQTGRVNTSRRQQLDDAARLYGYGVVDRADTGQRATNENTFFGQDLGDQKLYQATQAGWMPPSAPTVAGYLTTVINKKRPNSWQDGAAAALKGYR